MCPHATLKSLVSAELVSTFINVVFKSEKVTNRCEGRDSSENLGLLGLLSAGVDGDDHP
jgi:hypothetical protein